MGAKKILPSFKIINNGVMTGTNTITSTTIDISNLDNIGLQITWTGTPTGTISINASIDEVAFIPLVFTPALGQPAGSGSSYLVRLNQVPYKFFNVTYVNTSGSGVLNIFIFAKDLN